tara:strand:- start:280 stop:501 length:222 start_codon:yes stop_codon:yes gene_type:complete
MYDKGTNEYVDEEDGRSYEPREVDVDATNDEMWLRKKEEEEQQQQAKEEALQSALDDWGGRTEEHYCCRGDCK